MKTSDSIKTVLIETLHDVFGQTASRKDIIKYFKDKSENAPSWLVNSKEYRLTKGLMNLPRT